ncbi:MAG: lytic transglycosylase domain-containing protein [Pseudomonadota bacterium]
MHEPGYRSARRTAISLIVFASLALLPSIAGAQVRPPVQADNQSLDTYITEAAVRFSIPPLWIRAVIKIESDGDPNAVSHAGAMGLMQVMPRTWDELREKYGLGKDPFDRRSNVFAGTAYLREMYDRFGWPGALAAYNAGPARYEDHILSGRLLPKETREYVTNLLAAIESAHQHKRTKKNAPDRNEQRSSPLFASTAGRLRDRIVHLTPNAFSNDMFVRLRGESAR